MVLAGSGLDPKLPFRRIGLRDRQHLARPQLEVLGVFRPWRGAALSFTLEGQRNVQCQRESSDSSNVQGQDSCAPCPPRPIHVHAFL